MTDKPPEPIPRLRHVKPGQTIRIWLCDKRCYSKPEPLLSADDKYGYFATMKASLCQSVDRGMMIFGEGGWRVNEKGMT